MATIVKRGNGATGICDFLIERDTKEYVNSEPGDWPEENPLLFGLALEEGDLTKELRGIRPRLHKRSASGVVQIWGLHPTDGMLQFDACSNVAVCVVVVDDRAPVSKL